MCKQKIHVGYTIFLKTFCVTSTPLCDDSLHTLPVNTVVKGSGPHLARRT